MSYNCRMIASQTGAALDVTVELQQQNNWVPIQAWALEVLATESAAQRREALSDSAEVNGWVLPLGRWPKMRTNGQLVLEDVRVGQWLPVVAGATAMRSSLLEEFVVLERAWREVIVEAQAANRVAVGQIATAAGISRHRVHQIRTADREAYDHVTPGKIVAAAATQKGLNA